MRCWSHAGIVPYINASIVLQLLSTTFPSLKKLQREEGPQASVADRLLHRRDSAAVYFRRHGRKAQG